MLGCSRGKGQAGGGGAARPLALPLHPAAAGQGVFLWLRVSRLRSVQREPVATREGSRMASKAATSLVKPATADYVISKVDQLVNWVSCWALGECWCQFES